MHDDCKDQVDIEKLHPPGVLYLILLLLLYGISFLLEPKNNDDAAGFVNPNASGYLSLEKDTLDVFIVGNSDAYSGFSPMEMWKNYGFTSYISGTGKQLIGESVRAVEECLKTQKPKVVILETDQLYTNSNSAQVIARDARKQILNQFSVLEYHDRWKQFDPKTAVKRKSYSARFASKGQFVSGAKVPYRGKEYIKKTKKRDEINPLFVRKLDELNALCKKNGAQLILVQVPSQTTWTYARHNAVNDYAKKNGIPFLDMDLKRKEIGFSWKTDSRDGGNHLNCYGAQKVSLYVGQYIKNHVQLEDKRQNAAYAGWNEDYTAYIKHLEEGGRCGKRKGLRRANNNPVPNDGLRKNSPIPATLTIPPFKLFLSNKDTKTVAVLMLRQLFCFADQTLPVLRFPCVAFKNVWLNVYNGFSVGDFCGTMEQALCIT